MSLDLNNLLKNDHVFLFKVIYYLFVGYLIKNFSLYFEKNIYLTHSMLILDIMFILLSSHELFAFGFGGDPTIML